MAADGRCESEGSREEVAVSCVSGDRTADNWQEYQKAKKAAKKAVAVAKATHYGDVYRELESRDGERYLYRLPKTRHRQTDDIGKFVGINDESGHLLTDRKKALK
ncbi:unnamed protein product [Heligmosomoides polygyrus]|uniref:Cystatin domain-containing protein n=1 Tax=Heligmosomoides polygyrus TaxID=6339 RepID=A0A183GQ17_HELPZ|nr:unnamed protein product [Heligmosomoides polygyrus]